MNNDFEPDLWHQGGFYTSVGPIARTTPKLKKVTTRYNPNLNWFLTSIWFEVLATHPVTGEVKTKRDTRTFGYYKGWDKAYNAVKENRCNMHECLYQYLVMECIGEGVHPLPKDEQWFKWTGKRWKECRKPKALQGITNWGLG